MVYIQLKFVLLKKIQNVSQTLNYKFINLTVLELIY